MGPITQPNDCPPGYYCPAGTGISSSFPCPPGTYNPGYNLAEESDCAACTAGSHCFDYGLSTPSGECYAGYYCTGGAISPTPRNESVRAWGDSQLTVFMSAFNTSRAPLKC